MTRIHIKKMQEIVEFFQLKQRRDGHYQTAWGHKNIEGLRESLENLINEEVKAQSMTRTERLDEDGNCIDCEEQICVCDQLNQVVKA